MGDEERARALFFAAADQFDAGDYPRAEALFREVLTLVPERSSVVGNLAATLLRQDRLDEALALAERAVALDDANADALLVLASAQLQLSRFEPALASFERLATLAPDNPETWAGLAETSFSRSRWPEAAAAYDRLLALDPHYKYARGARAFAKLNMLDWDGIDRELGEVIADIRNGLPASPPFPAAAISDQAADQLACARRFVADKLPAAEPLWNGQRYVHDRIRIAYVSPDFRDHPTAFLAAGLFEHHDRNRFETVALSLGPDDGSALRRQRLPAAFDRFIDVRGRPDRDIAGLIREMEIDIAVDLGGFTQDARTGVFAMRPAPVQINYLGFPATMGAPFIDYIIADRFVIPGTSRKHYAEMPVYLPDTFQANDDRRPRPPKMARAEAGLTDGAFVFCCFNNHYKLRPEFFDIWMRLLVAVPGSVLWLVGGRDAAEDKLRREARRTSIDPERLVFATRKPYDDHLARFQLADLFLDTLPYNGGATASDALWCGVPVVTVAGDAFAARMAGSLLIAAGLPDLIAESLADYEALALRLARDPAALAAARTKLAANRETSPLFDTRRFTRHIEAAYRQMWERSQRGEPPASFSVAPLD